MVSVDLLNFTQKKVIFGSIFFGIFPYIFKIKIKKSTGVFVCIQCTKAQYLGYPNQHSDIFFKRETFNLEPPVLYPARGFTV